MHRCHRRSSSKYGGADCAATRARTVESQPSIVRTGKSRCPLPPAPGRAHAVRRANRKPPLTVESLWAIKRIAAPDARAGRRARLRRRDELRHGRQRQHDRALALPDGPRRQIRRETAPAHRRRQGQRSEMVARRRCDRVHREAQGRRGAADLSDRTRRRRGAAADVARDRLCGDQMVRRRQADRVRFVGVAGSRVRRGAGEAQEGAQGREGQGARHRARGIPLLGPLAHRRPRAARLHLRCRDRPLPRRARRNRPRAAAVGTEGRGLRHRAGRPRAGACRRPRSRAADDESAGHRHRRSRDAAQARPDRRVRNRRRRAGLFAGRSRARVSCVRHEALVQRPGTPHAARAPHRTHPAARAAARPARPARRVGARLALAAVHDRGSRTGRLVAVAGARDGRRDGADADRRRRHHRRLRAIARRLGAGLRARERRCTRRRSSRVAATAPASARSRRSIALAGAPRDGRSARGDGQGLGRGARPDVDRLSAEFRSEQEVAAAADDPRRTACGASRHVAFPLEHAGVRGPRLCRGRRELPRLVGLRPEVAGDDRRPLRREGIRGRRGRHRLAAAAGLHRPHAARRDRRQLRRLHGRLHERPHRSLQDVRLPRRMLRLGQHDGDRRLPASSPTSWARSTGTIRRASCASRRIITSSARRRRRS